MTTNYSIRYGSIVGLVLEKNLKFLESQFGDTFGIVYVNKARNEENLKTFLVLMELVFLHLVVMKN